MSGRGWPSCERENQRLRMERDLLKRAAAFFAKETETR